MWWSHVTQHRQVWSATPRTLYMFYSELRVVPGVQKPFAAAESFVTLNLGSHWVTLHSLRVWCLEYQTRVVCLLSLLMSRGSLHRNKNVGPDVYRWNLSGNWSPEEWKANICLSSPGKGDERCQCSLVIRWRGTGGSWVIRTKRYSLQELGLGLPHVRFWPDDFLIFHWVFAPRTRFCPNCLSPELLLFLVCVLGYFQSPPHSVWCLFLFVSLLPSLLTGISSRNDTEQGSEVN